MMSYVDLNRDFSQFDRDDMNRYLTAVYLDQANHILGPSSTRSTTRG